MSIENGSTEEQIENIEQQSVSDDPCEEVVIQETPGNTEPATEPTDPVEETSVVVPPFLAPIESIESPARYVNREITIINRTLFVEDSYEGSEYTAQHLETPEGEYKDPLRVLYGHHWNFKRLRDVQFASRDIDWNEAYENGVDSYQITDEQFSSTTRYWTGKVKMIKKFSSATAAISAQANASENYSSFEIPRVRNSENSNYFYPYLKDNVFVAPQPFHGSELDNIEIPSLTHASVKAHVNYYEEKPHVPETSIASIYRTYYKSVHNFHENCDFDDVVQKFTSDSVATMKEANESIKHAFNHFVEITIPTQQGSKICTLLDEFEMDKYFLELVSSNYMVERPYVQAQDQTVGTVSQGTRGYDIQSTQLTSVNDRYLTNATNHTSPDPFYNLITTIKDRDLSFFENLNHVTYPLKYELWQNPEGLRFTDTIRSQILMNKIEEQILDKVHIRSLSEIWSGQKAFSEVVGYKISKHEVVEDVVNPVPIQNFFIMDSDKVLTIEFIDTQVNPGKTYAYRIHSLNLVIGSKYTYVPVTEDWQVTSYTNKHELHKSFEAVVRPDIRIIEAPFFEKILTVIEKPPLAPLVSFIPDQGVDDKMRILLQSSFGEMEQKPIKIFEEDQEIIDRMTESQEFREDGSLEYQTDSLPEKFEVIRLSKIPESYQDFSDPDYVTSMPLDGQAAIFEDTNFQPNKDYYYCFRTYDKIGVSNPTQVYKINLRSYSNGIFLQVNQHEMRTLQEKEPPIIFHRALKITPAFQQTALTFDQDTDIESREFAESAPDLVDFTIGDFNQPETIWGKKYKFRILSKKTGKKIDLNVEFVKFRRERLPFDATQTEGESNPCASTELDLQIGNDGGRTVEIVEDPVPGDTGITGDELLDELPEAPDLLTPTGGGYEQAQNVLEYEQIGNDFGQRTGLGNEVGDIFGSIEGKDMTGTMQGLLGTPSGDSPVSTGTGGILLTTTSALQGSAGVGTVGDDVFLDTASDGGELGSQQVAGTFEMSGGNQLAADAQIEGVQVQGGLAVEGAVQGAVQGAFL